MYAEAHRGISTLVLLILFYSSIHHVTKLPITDQTNPKLMLTPVHVLHVIQIIIIIMHSVFYLCLIWAILSNPTFFMKTAHMYIKFSPVCRILVPEICAVYVYQQGSQPRVLPTERQPGN